MMLGARTGAWAKSGSGAPTARDYVQDGLIAMWDGIENAGWGVHDPNATVWKDLSGNGYDLVVSDVTKWEDDRINCGKRIAFFNEGSIHYNTIECCLHQTAYENNSRVAIASGDGRFIIFSSGGMVEVQFASGARKGYRRSVSWGSGEDATLSAYVDDNYNVSNVHENANVCEISNYSNTWGNGDGRFSVGNRSDTNESNYAFKGWIYCLRLYNRALTDFEITANYSVDKARFNLP